MTLYYIVHLASEVIIQLHKLPGDASQTKKNIDPAANTVPTPIPSLAAYEVRSRASQIQENPTCSTVAPDDSTTADHNPSCSTSKEFNIQTVVETLFTEFKCLMASHWEPLFLKKWSDEFIDMNSLTSSYVKDPFSLFVSNRKFSLDNTSRSNKPPLSIEQWTSAFLVFSDIYIEKCPEEARHLLKYGHNIREMYDLYGDEPWRIYDEKFRRLRETIKLPWGKLIDELYTKSANTSNTQNKNFHVQPARKNKTFSKPRQYNTTVKNIHPNSVKTCILFNRGQTCNKPCSYKHVCHYCKGSHARFQCTEYKPQENAQQNKQMETKIPTVNKLLEEEVQGYDIDLSNIFIRRLNRFMNSCDKFDNLRLLKSYFLINCRAQGGLTVARLAEQKQLCTFSYHLHIVFLQIGGNDAANRTNAYQIAQDIFAFAMYLHYGLNVNHVIIGQLLYQSESVTYAGYNDKVIQINTLLQEKIKEHDENAISFWHHHGFWDNLDFLCFDGVHLNHFGMCKYFKSVRSAVLHTSNQ
ncbi:unnamed protein product [Mytilus coruscus]|uniref:C3H1-type domain-containing protein n=1 Tax=Mytilus coruscus TaxID=42192 RepID=A0A6J8DZ13_MYTCO|nr:unnamed protein product [Mytilus coruscus]